MLILIVAQQNAEAAVRKVVTEPHLLETLGEVLNSKHSAEKTKLNVLWVYSNIMAEIDAEFRNEVLARGQLLTFLDSLMVSFPKNF